MCMFKADYQDHGAYIPWCRYWDRIIKNDECSKCKFKLSLREAIEYVSNGEK